MFRISAPLLVEEAQFDIPRSVALPKPNRFVGLVSISGLMDDLSFFKSNQHSYSGCVQVHEFIVIAVVKRIQNDSSPGI